MTMTTANALSEAAVAAILKEVFSAMVNLPLETPAEAALAEGDAPAATAIVGLIGKPGRMVLLRADGALACRVAGGMLAAEYPAWCDEVRDAFSELANMVAGNIKAACFAEAGYSLSLPTVIYGSRYVMSSSRLRKVLEFRASSGRGEISVTVAEEV